MKSVRLPEKLAREFLESIGDYMAPDLQSRLYAALTAALKPKRSAAPAQRRRLEKKAQQREALEGIRDTVLWRANGRCEACTLWFGAALEIDHFFGGSGRRRQLQSVHTCWALCRACHGEKTRNEPSAAHWLEAFVEHTKKHKYDGARVLAQARLDALTIQGRGT